MELRRLESIGAAVEPARPGVAFFEADGLRPLWGGTVERVLRRAQRALETPARLGGRARTPAASPRAAAAFAALAPAGAR